MYNIDIINSSNKELSNPQEETTVELLQFVELNKVDGNFCIKHIKEYEDEFAVFYEIKNQKFLFATYISKYENFEFKYSVIEPYYEVYLSATTKHYTKIDLESKTNLRFDDGWSIDDKWNVRTRNFTCVKIRLKNSEYFYIEYLIDEFINQLWNESKKIKVLNSLADCKIVVASWQHVTNVNGLNLNKKTLINLAKFDMDIDYMPYVFR